MAEVNPPFVIDGTTVAGEEIRRTLKGLYASAGPLSSTALAVTANGTPNMSVNVASGEAIIFGTEQTEQGAYHIYNDATVNKTIAAADPTNPRDDLVVAKVQDAEYSGATRAWSLAVVQGTPAASPSDPAVPANSISLARVRVDAAVTSIVSGKITDLRARATSNLTFVASSAEVLTTQTTTSVTYTDLATVGPAVTLTTGTKVRVDIYSWLGANAIDGFALASFAVSGATTQAASDTLSVVLQEARANVNTAYGASFLVSGLTPGSNTFTMKYRQGGTVTATFLNRKIIVTRLD